MRGLSHSESLVRLFEVLALVQQLTQQLKDLRIEPLESLIALDGAGRRRRRPSKRADKDLRSAMKLQKITGGIRNDRALLDMAVDGLGTAVDFSRQIVEATGPPVPVATALRAQGIEIFRPDKPTKKGVHERAVEIGCIAALPSLAKAVATVPHPVIKGGLIAVIGLCALELGDVAVVLESVR